MGKCGKFNFTFIALVRCVLHETYLLQAPLVLKVGYVPSMMHLKIPNMK